MARLARWRGSRLRRRGSRARPLAAVRDDASDGRANQHKSGSHLRRICFVIRISSFVIVSSFEVSLFVILLLASCDKPQNSRDPAAVPAVASMVPAATDLIVGMGAKDRLVAVSSYDKDRPDVGGLPKAGDYERVDWEVLRQLHPSVLISEIAPDRQSPGFKANLAELNITSLDVKIETLDDICRAVDTLGDALKEPGLATAAKLSMHQRLDAVRQRVAGLPRVRTLIVIDSNAQGIAGPGTYLDDLLKLAGGENAVDSLQQHWPEIDREMLLTMKPQAIIQLLPDASPQVRDQAAAVWKQYPQIPAVAAGRVYPIYDGYALLPGWHVTDLAERFSRDLHP